MANIFLYDWNTSNLLYYLFTCANILLANAWLQWWYSFMVMIFLHGWNASNLLYYLVTYSNILPTSYLCTVAAIFCDAHPAFILLCTNVKLRCMSMDAIDYTWPADAHSKVHSTWRLSQILLLSRSDIMSTKLHSHSMGDGTSHLQHTAIWCSQT